MRIAESYKKRVVQMYGGNGARWIESIERIISFCEGHWRIKVFNPFDLSYNYVAGVQFSDGSSAVLKLFPATDECRREALALQIDNGKTMCRLIDSIEAKGILLLQRLDPGINLTSITNDSRALEVACNILVARKRVMSSVLDLPTQADFKDDIDKITSFSQGKSLPFGNHVTIKMRDQFHDLVNTQKQLYLLHGDFHQQNILAHGDEWKLIDPKH